MSYTLTSPIPAIQDISSIGGNPVTEGITSKSGFISWIDGDSVIHLIAFFGGFTYGNWNAHYVNITTPTNHAIILAAAPGDARAWCRDPVSNKVYAMTNYQGSVTEIDPDDPTNPVVLSTTCGHSGEMIIGSDGKLYVIDCAINPYHIFSYDPAVGIASWTDFGAIPNASSAQTGIGGIGATADNIYAAIKKTNNAWTLVSSPNSYPPTWTEWEFAGSGDTEVNIYIGTDDNWYVVRDLSGGGTLTYLLDDTAPKYHYAELPPDMQTMVNAPRYLMQSNDLSDPFTRFADYIGYDSNFLELFPIKDIHEESKIGWAVHNSGSWNWSTLSFTGPWVAHAIRQALPDNDTVFCLSQDYNAAFSLDYLTPARTYLGPEVIAPYCLVKHPTSGEWYAGGYSNFVWRYNHNLDWTLTIANSDTISGGGAPGVDGRPNPYRIDLPGTIYHYRHGIAFDANGLVWIGGNTTRTSPIYGNVGWYDPSDGTTGYLYDWSSGIAFRSICSCLGGTKILVSSNDGYIHRIDASNKSDDNVDLDVSSASAWMVETSSDRVMVVMSVADTAQTIGILQPSDMTWSTGPQSLGVSGIPFGFTNIGEYLRMYRKLELGPDGFVWMFVGTILYRIDPTQDPLVLEEIVDVESFSALKFANSGTDLFLYNINGDPDDGYHGVKYIQGILTYSSDYSRGSYISLPAADADLDTPYTGDDIADVATDDTDMVAQLATSQIAIHQFKQQINGTGGIISVVAQVTIPCATSTAYLQIYNRSGTPAWDTIDSDNATGANTDFTLSATVADLTDYKDENNIVACRVYQEMQ